MFAVACCGGGADVSAGVRDFSCLELDAFHEVSEAWLYEREGTLVFWFFLGPHDLGILVSFKGALNTSEWEWSQLFDSNDCDVIRSTFGPFGLQVVVDLATAEDNLSNLVISDHFFAGIVDNFDESQTLSEFLDVRASLSQFEEFLW